MELSPRQSSLYALAFKAQADKAEALASLNILLNHPAGIGDHSTTDFHRNLNEALDKLASADGRLVSLNTYYPELQNFPNGNG